MVEAFVLEDVWKRYGATMALRGVSLRMGRGLNVVVGPNGSGKTTMVRLLLGMARPTRGRVYTLGRDPGEWRDEIMRLVGVGVEGMALPWWLSGLDVLRAASESRGLDWPVVREVAGMLGVDSYWRRSIRGYSMGMRKRVILALAFSTAREALVLDEPFTLLDAKTRSVVDSLILRYSKELPVIVTTHVVTPSTMRADTATVIVSGRVVASATVDSVGLRDLLCEPESVEEAAVDLLRAGRPEHMEIHGGRIVVSYSSEPDSGVVARHNCSPSLVRLLRYEELLGERVDWGS